MADETCEWIGESKTFYTYFVCRLPVSFIEKQNGNYIFAKSVVNRWRPIYIGQGDLGKIISADHHKIDCIEDKGATHVHVHLNANEKNRKNEEKDLLENYTQAYEPIGCNEEKGS